MSARQPPLLENSPAMQRILAALKACDLTEAEISERAFIARSSLQKGQYLSTMRRRGEIHICAWRKPLTTGNWAPIFRAGPGESVPRPAATTNSIRAKTYRHRSGNERTKIKRQMRKLTPQRFTMAGQLGVAP